MKLFAVHTFYLLDFSGGVQGMASDIRIVAEDILLTRSRLNALYKHHTGQEMSKIESIMERSVYTP